MKDKLLTLSTSAVLLLALSVAGAAAAVQHDEPFSVRLTAEELESTLGGAEVRLTNLGSTQPLLYTFSSTSGNRLHLEVTSTVPETLYTPFAQVTAKAVSTAFGTTVDLPVTLLGLVDLGASNGGVVATYEIDASPACTLGSAAALSAKVDLFFGFAIGETSRFVGCSG